ncbi:hypothetical protein KAFR_0D03490 [Kazachstania africana CBS 2517]|uniref:Protein ECM9 n=1 Tax=Kazachstania africana (strain ATCC 22294 / BCRC 22015 / CBS 2517 / CECT 1963 / NBRC 1671 / NRRL Y-8276) TaxID=1071382 RepID=H2AUE7_KAZAF|nr:hypothetical protein KAFR_0D03490 [Kazachstania africana CBS 2517]CCF57997.1 hypothetical protein KAFR_0D03490 [Kazachstania africana CBS 2517]
MISTKGKFCKELFEILTSEHSVNQFKLTIAPDEEITSKNHYYIDKSNDETRVEAICFKSTYVSIFMEAHNFLNPGYLSLIDSMYRLKNMPFFSVIQIYRTNIVTDFDKQYEVYVFTIGLLLTTTENKTNLNLHEEIFLKLLLKLEKTSSSSQIITFFENELRVVERLLSSSNNKLNKSSSLWYFYRKLYVLSQKIPLLSQRTDRDIIIKTHIYSASEHRSNYYCWNTARWFFYLFPPSSKEIFLKATEKFCFANTNDCSAWSALGYMVSNDVIEQKFTFENYKYIEGKYSETFPGTTSLIQSNFGIEMHSFSEKVAQFIDKLEVKEWPPFLCILKILHSIPEESLQSTSFVNRWKNELNSFEEKNRVD